MQPMSHRYNRQLQLNAIKNSYASGANEKAKRPKERRNMSADAQDWANEVSKALSIGTSRSGLFETIAQRT